MVGHSRRERFEQSQSFESNRSQAFLDYLFGSEPPQESDFDDVYDDDDRTYSDADIYHDVEVDKDKQLETGDVETSRLQPKAPVARTNKYRYIWVATLLMVLLCVILGALAGKTEKDKHPKQSSGQEEFGVNGTTVAPSSSPSGLRTPAPTLAPSSPAASGTSSPTNLPANTPEPSASTVLPTPSASTVLPTTSPTAATTPVPSVASSASTVPGTSQPTLVASGLEVLITELRDFLGPLSPDGGAALLNETTPQSQALRLLAQKHQQSNRTLSHEKIVQHFVVTTLFLATGGDQWAHADSWLADLDECNWYFNGTDQACDVDGFIVNLELQDNNLQGTIPPEVAMLSVSLARINLSHNVLNGAIPTALGLLTHASQLQLTGNQFVGTLPSELGMMPKLETLSVGENELTGTLPTELGSLKSLKILGMEGNAFTGTIPSQFGRLTNVEQVSFQGNQFSGFLPWQVRRWSKLQSLSLNGNGFIGTVPTQLCPITYLAADCGEIICDCCTECCVDSSGCTPV